MTVGPRTLDLLDALDELYGLTASQLVNANPHLADTPLELLEDLIKPAAANWLIRPAGPDPDGGALRWVRTGAGTHVLELDTA